MDSAGILLGRWTYTDENTEPEDGTVVEFTKAAAKGRLSAKFLMEEECINATMDCTLTAEGIVIEESGEEISNRYEGVISEDGRTISGTWLCTKSSMTGPDATREGDSGQFELIKDGKAPAANAGYPAAAAAPVQEVDPVTFLQGRWNYSDDSGEDAADADEDGMILEFSNSGKGRIVATFIVEGSPSEPHSVELKGNSITIHEVSEHISTDYVTTIDGNVLSGTWTCIKSQDEDTAVGDSGEFTLTKEGQ